MQVFDSVSVQNKCQYAEISDPIRKYVLCHATSKTTWKRTYFRVIDKNFSKQKKCPLYVYSKNKVKLKYKRICQKVTKDVKVFCKREEQSNVARNLILILVSATIIGTAFLCWWHREKLKVSRFNVNIAVLKYTLRKLC